MRKTHVMIDLETLGTKTSSVFLSLAAVPFDPATGEMEDAFTANIDLKSALDFGLTIDADTMKWWLTQKPEVMQKMFYAPSALADVLNDFYVWWHLGKYVHPWGNSASFDLKIMEHAYDRVKGVCPWKFYNERCYRTLASLVEVDVCKPANAHDPVVDCHYQIKKLSLVWNKLKL